MYMQEKETFEKNWQKFITRIRGQMMSQMKNGFFSYGTLDLILADSLGFWESKDFEGARWLDEFERSHPDKAQRVRAILLEDMRFTEEPLEKPKGKVLSYAVPVGSAVAGLLAARAAGAGKAVQIAGALVPAVVTASVTDSAVRATADKKEKEWIDLYLRQLDKYRLSVESILDELEREG